MVVDLKLYTNIVKKFKLPKVKFMAKRKTRSFLRANPHKSINEPHNSKEP